MISQGIQRVDSAHFAWVSCVSVALLPVAVFEVLRLRTQDRRSVLAPHASARSRSRSASCCSFPHFTGWSYADFVAQTFGKHRLAFPITRNGRTFYYGRPDVAKSAQDLLDVIPKYATPGDKLFVGPTDLRKTPYSDAYLYYLLPEYAPGHVLHRDGPGRRQRRRTRGMPQGPRALAARDPVRASGTTGREPNDSRKFGSDEEHEGPAPRLLPPGLVRTAPRRRPALRALDPASRAVPAPAPPRRRPATTRTLARTSRRPHVHRPCEGVSRCGGARGGRGCPTS